MRIHSLLSPKCEVRRSGANGQGVFASADFTAQELVAVWGGKVYTAAEIAELGKVLPHFETHPVSLFHGYYLGSENLFELDDAEFFNHSCDANIGVKGQVVVVTRRMVKADEELMFNYETTEMAVRKPFRCQCGSAHCRGLIDGGGWKDRSFVKRNQGYFSWYIRELLQGAEPLTNP